MLYCSCETSYEFKSEEELEELDEDELIDYLMSLNEYNYHTGELWLTDEYLYIIDECLNAYFDEDYLSYLKYVCESHDIFILSDYEFDKYDYRKSYLLYEYRNRNEIVTSSKFDDIIYYDHSMLIDYINEVYDIPSRLSDFIDYNGIIRGMNIETFFYITGHDGDYEMLDLSELEG